MIGYKVMALFSEPDGSNGQVADFLTGFSSVIGDNDAVRGKPVGITSDECGSLYITSDECTNAIMKIVPQRLGMELGGKLPEAALAGTELVLDITVRPTALDPEGEPPVVSVDLSALNGPEELVLTPVGNNTYQLNTRLADIASSGTQAIFFTLQQQTSFDKLLTVLKHQIDIFPAADLLLFGDELAPTWRISAPSRIEVLEFSPQMPVFAGENAIPLRIERARLGWSYTFRPDSPFDLLGYSSLQLAFHPGTTRQQTSADEDRIRLDLSVRPGKAIKLLGEGLVDLNTDAWQVVELSLEDMAAGEPIESIGLSGNLEGTFYLDDLRLVADPQVPITAVLTERSAALPEDFGLEQNYPNPFNSATIIRFNLTKALAIDLAIYNLTGQKVATLATGKHSAGAYTLHWDGRDTSGRKLASGLYLYRLQAGAQHTQTRKMVLVQ